MFKEEKIKTPRNSKTKNLITNFSFDMSKSKDNNSKDNRTIYKLHDRLFNSKIISLLAKNKNNFSRNILNLNPITKKVSNSKNTLKQIKNFRFKSFDRKLYLNFSPNRNNKKRIFSTIEGNQEEDKPRISFIYHRDNELNRRESMVFLNESPEISFQRGPKNRKKYMLVNQIIKFNLKLKKEERKVLSPMKLRKSYFDFIEKKNKVKYNPNFNSPFIHRMNSNYYLDNIFHEFGEKLNALKLKRRKSLDEIEKKELELEKRDKIEEMSVDLQNYKKAIKIFLTDETKLNQIYFQEKFFDSYVNKINYLFDDRKFPTIKNKLKKIVMIFQSVAGCEWTRLNMIEKSTLTYLHKLKAKIQRELDEIKEENKVKQFKINQQIGKYSNQKIRKKRKNLNKSSVESEKNEEENNNKCKNNNNEKEEENNEEEEEEEEIVTNKEDLYELEEFFVHKGRSNKTIIFATDKAAYAVYNNPKFYKDPLKIKRKKSTRRGKSLRGKKIEFDFYI